MQNQTHAQSESILQVRTKDNKTVSLYQDYQAVVIGVGEYVHLPRLRGAVRDAREVAARLKELGFQVQLHLNPTSSQLKKILNDLPYKTGKKKDRGLLIYYAGHGETETLADGTKLGYLTAIDCPLPGKDPAAFFGTCVSMSVIEDLAKRIRSRHVLMAFDSCFSGALFNTGRAMPRDISEKIASPVRLFITAGTEDEEVPDRSVFKTVFLDGISGEADYDRDGYVTGSELGMYLQKQVVNYSRGAQHPQFGKIRNPKLDKGDFVLKVASGSGGQGVGDSIVIGTRPAVGTVEIWTNVGGVEVEIAGKKFKTQAGQTTVLSKVPARMHEVKAGKKGYEGWSKRFTIEEGRTVRVRILMKKTKKNQAATPAPVAAGSGPAGQNIPTSSPLVKTSPMVITKRDCSLYQSPEPGAQSSPCGAFQYWYVLSPKKEELRIPTDDPKKLQYKGYYRVSSGYSENEFRGYIKAEDAHFWTHRLGLEMTPLDTRGPAFIYGTRKDALLAAESGRASKAAHGEPASRGDLNILMPVMEVREERVDGKRLRLFKTAFVSTTDPDIGNFVKTVGPKEPANKIRKQATVDVVFVVDTTAGTVPAISRLLRAVSKVTDKLRSDPDLARRIRYGLVGYRDTVGSPNRMGYVAKVFCSLEEGADHLVFLDRLGSLEEAYTSSGDYAEDVLAGIDLALNKEKLKWNPLAWKQIFVLADSSIKCEDHPVEGSRINSGNLTIPRIMAKAQSSGEHAEALKQVVAINAILVASETMSRDEKIAERQFIELVMGRSYSGILHIARGGTDSLEFSELLADELLSRYQNFKDTVVAGQALLDTSGKGGYSPNNRVKIPLPILTTLVKADSEGAPLKFDAGWVAEFDHHGNRLVNPKLWVRKGDIKSFNAFLNFLIQQTNNAGQPGSKNVPQILNSLKHIASVLDFQEPITAHLPLDRFFRVLGGFPLRSEIFHLTVNQLAGMNQTEYYNWVREIKAVIKSLEAIVEIPENWLKLHPQAEDREECAFISLHDLP